MQVFHSNEDLAGSHSYNIKATDKYAVFEVNDQSDSPKFEPAKAAAKTIYFVDCGDHDPSTVSSGDTLGTHNSVTDQIYSKDSTEYTSKTALKKAYTTGHRSVRMADIYTPQQLLQEFGIVKAKHIIEEVLQYQPELCSRKEA